MQLICGINSNCAYCTIVSTTTRTRHSFTEIGIFSDRREILEAVHRGTAQKGLRDEREVLRRQAVLEQRRSVLRRPAHGGHGDGGRLPREHRRGGAGLAQQETGVILRIIIKTSDLSLARVTVYVVLFWADQFLSLLSDVPQTTNISAISWTRNLNGFQPVQLKLVRNRSWNCTAHICLKSRESVDCQSRTLFLNMMNEVNASCRKIPQATVVTDSGCRTEIQSSNLAPVICTNRVEETLPSFPPAHFLGTGFPRPRKARGKEAFLLLQCCQIRALGWIEHARCPRGREAEAAASRGMRN